MFNISTEDVLSRSKALNPEAYITDLSLAMEAYLEQQWIKISSFLNPVGKNFLGNFDQKFLLCCIKLLEIHWVILMIGMLYVVMWCCYFYVAFVGKTSIDYV